MSVNLLSNTAQLFSLSLCELKRVSQSDLCVLCNIKRNVKCNKIDFLTWRPCVYALFRKRERRITKSVAHFWGVPSSSRDIDLARNFGTGRYLCRVPPSPPVVGHLREDGNWALCKKKHKSTEIIKFLMQHLQRSSNPRQNNQLICCHWMFPNATHYSKHWTLKIINHFCYLLADEARYHSPNVSSVKEGWAHAFVVNAIWRKETAFMKYM